MASQSPRNLPSQPGAHRAPDPLRPSRRPGGWLLAQAQPSFSGDWAIMKVYFQFKKERERREKTEDRREKRKERRERPNQQLSTMPGGCIPGGQRGGGQQGGPRCTGRKRRLGRACLESPGRGGSRLQTWVVGVGEGPPQRGEGRALKA